ncbi:MAG: pyrroline-5-carboxylate reductase [Chloroflexi bacterium]|nr:pyrroline-5-carboxylate reductase [Chloroflexota bacterium]
MKIAFIGGGNMGEAMLSAILEKKLSIKKDIIVCDISDVRHRHLRQKYGVAVTKDNREAVQGGQVIVLAIKPQNLAAVIAELKGQLKPDQLVVSIIAGARISTLRQGLKHDCIVRAMPNTPGQIGEGITVWTATPGVTEQQKGWASSILGVMGKEIYVDDEKYIDMATAVSGSGPAYFFLFVEALVEAAVHIGLPRNIAQELVLQTMLGSGHLLQKSGKEPGELRRMVTSPGGTTAEALQAFEKGEFAGLVQAAVSAACDKAQRLGEQSPTV